MWNVAHGNLVLRNSQIFEKLVRKSISLSLKGSSPLHKNKNQSKHVNLNLQKEILQPCSHRYFGAVFWLV